MVDVKVVDVNIEQRHIPSVLCRGRLLYLANPSKSGRCQDCVPPHEPNTTSLTPPPPHKIRVWCAYGEKSTAAVTIVLEIR